MATRNMPIGRDCVRADLVLGTESYDLRSATVTVRFSRLGGRRDSQKEPSSGSSVSVRLRSAPNRVRLRLGSARERRFLGAHTLCSSSRVERDVYGTPCAPPQKTTCSGAYGDDDVHVICHNAQLWTELQPEPDQGAATWHADCRSDSNAAHDPGYVMGRLF